MTSYSNQSINIEQKKRRKISKQWVINDVPDLCDRRRELKRMKKEHPGLAWQYGNVNINVRKRMKQIKE